MIRNLSWFAETREDHEIVYSPLNRPNGPRRPAVAICGSAYNVKHAPLEDDHWDVWALNNCAPIDSAGRLRADRWWEIHAQEVRTEDRWETMHRIAEHIPVMIMDTRLGFGRFFDVDALVQCGFRDYFADTFAYELAYAIALDYHEIGLYGAHLLTGSDREATVEAACVSYWLGVAEGKGITVRLPTVPMGLLQSRRYGDENERLEVALYTAARRLAAQERLLREEQRNVSTVAHGLFLTDVLGG